MKNDDVSANAETNTCDDTQTKDDIIENNLFSKIDNDVEGTSMQKLNNPSFVDKPKAGRACVGDNKINTDTNSDESNNLFLKSNIQNNAYCDNDFMKDRIESNNKKYMNGNVATERSFRSKKHTQSCFNKQALCQSFLRVKAKMRNRITPQVYMWIELIKYSMELSLIIVVLLGVFYNIIPSGGYVSVFYDEITPGSEIILESTNENIIEFGNDCDQAFAMLTTYELQIVPESPFILEPYFDPTIDNTAKENIEEYENNLKKLKDHKDQMGCVYTKPFEGIHVRYLQDDQLESKIDPVTLEARKYMKSKPRAITMRTWKTLLRKPLNGSDSYYLSFGYKKNDNPRNPPFRMWEIKSGDFRTELFFPWGAYIEYEDGERVHIMKMIADTTESIFYVNSYSDLDDGGFLLSFEQDTTFDVFFNAKDSISTSGNGVLNYSNTANIKEYELHSQKVVSSLRDESNVRFYNSPTIQQFAYEGMVDDVSIAGFQVTPSLEGWLLDNPYLLPSIILTILGGAITLTISKKESKGGK